MYGPTTNKNVDDNQENTYKQGHAIFGGIHAIKMPTMPKHRSMAKVNLTNLQHYYGSLHTIVRL
jgi:hypothetical protein